MPDHKDVYARQAQQYELLVSCEDYQHHIETALKQITPLPGKDVVELGAGTGRLTRLLAPVVRSIQAFDVSGHMLAVAAAKLAQSSLHNWRLSQADHRSLPVADRAADLVISGWSICYLVDWNRVAWEAEVEKALAEMKRVSRPGGVIILLETLGTGFDSPQPPEHLSAYYRLLVAKDFSSTWIRTDYRFESPEQAVDLSRFFFGETLAEQIKAENTAILPECTGLWWLRMP